MANIFACKIEFLQNNLFGTYVAGDIIECYIDDTLIPPTITVWDLETTGVSAYLNGSPISSGTYILYDLPYATVIFGSKFCSGTTLIDPSPYLAFPYAVYNGLVDHYSCAVNPPTCNLIIIGSPTIIPASGPTDTDGSVIVSATSSNTIEYNLNSDFLYGTGQSSGVFSGLIRGSYRIFLRDSANCAANVLVVIGFTSGYGAKYRLEYDDLAGFKTKIDISERGYSGSVTEIKGGSNPFILDLRGEGGIDKFEAILASSATINLSSESNGAFTSLYTNDRGLYRVEYSKDTGAGYVLLWIGRVLPFNYQEELRNPPYYVSFVASDGLPELKDYYLIQKDGQKLYGKVKLIKLVAYCLNFLKLNLNIRVGCNLYATGMNTTSSDDPFDQAYIDYEAFYLAAEQPSISFVLGSILEAFNARIIQWGNKWNIVRVEELGNTIDYREFDSLGDYSSNGSFNPVKEIKYPSQNGLMWKSFPNRELRPGYGTIRVNYKLGLKPNIIDNGDFRLKSVYVGNNQYSFTIDKQGFAIVNSTYPLTETYERSDDNVALVISGGEQMLSDANGGLAYVQSATYTVRMGTNNQIKISIRYKVDRVSALFGGDIYKIEVPYVKVRLRVKYGSLYLQGDGSWTTTDSIIYFFITTFNEYQESEIVASQPTSGTPTSGMAFDVRLYHAYGYFAQFLSVASLQAFPTYSGGNQLIPTGYKTELRDDFILPADMYFYELEETTSAASGYLIIRPTDYHVSNNPRQWVQKYKAIVGTVSGANVFRFAIDKIVGIYLTDGKEPINTIIRKATSEPLNQDVFEKDIVIGSYSSLITTETNFSISLGVWFPDSGGGISQTTTNTLSADLIYAGWLRDVSGVGYEYWARDGVSESAKLHAIWLTSYTSQYNRTWSLIRGITASKTVYFGLLDVIGDTNDTDKIYMPISLSIDDFRNEVSGEFLELNGLTGGAGFPSSPGGPFTSGFSSGFGASGYN